jgi:hypothetical protein
LYSGISSLLHVVVLLSPSGQPESGKVGAAGSQNVRADLLNQL